MFQYTTETIINSNVGKLPGGVRFGVLDADGSNTAVKTAPFAGEDFLIIDGVNSFKIKNIKKIYKTAYRASSNATATLDLSGATIPTAKGTILRLTVSIHEQGSVRSTIQNAYLHKNKPFHYEIALPANATAANVVSSLVALIKKDMAMTDFAYFKASAAAKAGTPAVFDQLVLTADDCYIQFDNVELEQVLDGEAGDGSTTGARLLGYDVTKAITGLSAPVIVAGDEGQGTVARLVKNLRIPTNASINPFAADQGGKPIPGGKYTQYLIEYETKRAHVSGTVVGSVGEVSRTSHVFFIEDALANSTNGVWDALMTSVASAASISVEAAGRGDATGTGRGSNVTVTDGVPVLDEKKEMGSVE